MDVYYNRQTEERHRSPRSAERSGMPNGTPAERALCLHHVECPQEHRNARKAFVSSPPLSPYLLGVRCFACDRPHDPRALLGVCSVCGLPLRVDYDLASIRAAGTLTQRTLPCRPPSLWRYREVLPLLEGDETSLVEGFTPL